MHGIDGKRSDALWARGFAALWAALMAAAGGGALAAPTETVLHSFAGGSDGGFPGGGLIADSSGNLYGTTEGGSTRECLTLGNCGTVFKLSPSGSETVLYAFTRNESEAGLIADSSGNLFGTIPTGGASICGFDGDYGFGCGVVFKLSPGGTYTELHSFTGSSDGAFPGGLIADSSGNLYGTTGGGGASGCGGFGCGGVFKLSPGGSETVLYSFTGGIDGGGPTAGLIADSSGNLYGTTAFGGSAVCGGGCGVVFKLSPGGTETVLHTLNGFPSDGSQPEAGLIADSSGNLYGTTSQGGASGNGVVFKLSPGGTETVLYSFKGGSDGSHPQAGLIADSSGILYGTTPRGGGSVSGCDGGAGCGVVFKLSPGGTETVLYAFTNGSDGGEPLAGLIADSRGNLYGTTFRGGALGSGTVFKLAGTGFVPAIPFSAFGAKLGIQFGPTPNHDRFQIQASFTLGSASTGINPVAEPVTLQIGAFAVTIPPGSFTGTGFGPFAFGGVIDGVTLEVRIAPTGTKRYAFIAAAGNANLTGTVNPVPVTLTIGDDSGPTSVTAAIASGVATAH